jgi:hypothetical protein
VKLTHSVQIIDLTQPAQFFGCAHGDRMCVLVFIGVSARTCMSIYICTVFLKNNILITFV